ncbi:peptide chain release factor 1 [Armillaria borealis]|uniref:Peptide chain release factor 1 n=1 Tax=Armillaria borealis TaxID=47425 RepID=A0AA39K7Y9_9AGAR|nr:peptide chain release factor 1 [Armillaria borealis]
MFRHCRRFATSCIRLQQSSDTSRLLRVVEKRINERTQILSQISEGTSRPEDIARLKKIKESDRLQEAWDELNISRRLLEDTKSLLADPDPTMRSMAEEEYYSLEEKVEEIVDTTLPALLKPSSSTAHYSALVELKSGVGGVESSLFLADMLRMYQRYATAQRWKWTMMAVNELEQGGTRDAIMEVKGLGAYDRLRWESGVHRVQRVPSTDASGRVHTSTVAVIVLPLAEEKDTQDEPLYKMEDIKIEVMRARGAGGQHVNKTESAVRLTHIPSGITVSMQDERSQHQNKRRAFQVLQARLMDQRIIRDIAQRRATKNSLVSGVDRSDKIRTYNYAQERVTDHRIGLSLINLSAVLESNGLGEFIEALNRNYEQATLEQMLEDD